MMFANNNRAYCAWCASELTYETSTVDHVISLVNYGADRFENYLLSCTLCNGQRGKDASREIKLTKHNCFHCHESHPGQLCPFRSSYERNYGRRSF